MGAALRPSYQLRPSRRAILRRRSATQLYAADQRRKVELRAARGAVMKELETEQKRSQALRAELERRIESLSAEHQTQLDVLQASLAEADLQVTAAAARWGGGRGVLGLG